MNTPGQNDAILRAWIGFKPAFEKDRRAVPEVDVLKIEMVWMNVYFGGTANVGTFRRRALQYV